MKNLTNIEKQVMTLVHKGYTIHHSALSRRYFAIRGNNFQYVTSRAVSGLVRKQVLVPSLAYVLSAHWKA